jgi:hypothetical protein
MDLYELFHGLRSTTLSLIYRRESFEKLEVVDPDDIMPLFRIDDDDDGRLRVVGLSLYDDTKLVSSITIPKGVEIVDFGEGKLIGETCDGRHPIFVDDETVTLTSGALEELYNLTERWLSLPKALLI